MHFLNNRTRSSKIYSERSYTIPISNDFSHEAMSHETVAEEKHVQEKKQIEKIMHSVIKQRLFGNFFKEQTKVSDESYKELDSLYRKDVNGRLRSHRTHRVRSIRKDSTILQLDDKLINRRHTGIGFNLAKQMNTLDVSKVMPQYDPPLMNKMSRTSTFNSKSIEPQTVKKKPSLRDEFQKAFANMPFERSLTRDSRTQKLIPLFHQKKLSLIEKAFIDFYRKLVGAMPNQIIYDYKLTRQMLYNRFKDEIEPQLLERFFHFFGFPNSFGIRQYMFLLQNAANANLRFIYFWVFVLLDENGNGVLTNQDFFKIITNFKENQYIEEQVYMLVRWLNHHKGKFPDGQTLFQESLTANRNLRLQELQQLMKQTQKERIDVDCVKNTAYRQTIVSLEHNYNERLKLSQLEDTEVTTKALKSKMMEKKKLLEDQPKIRLRDFYIIFTSRRPKIFCFFLKLLANVMPEDYE